MALFTTVHQGLAYGEGVMAGAGLRGQIVTLTGNDTFDVNLDATAVSDGFLKSDVALGGMPTIMCNGGIYETDKYTAGIAAGSDLICGVDGFLAVATGGAGEIIIGRAISVVGGVLKFHSLI